MVECLQLMLRAARKELRCESLVLAPRKPVESLPAILHVRARGTHPPGLVLLRSEESWYAILRQFGRVSA